MPSRPHPVTLLTPRDRDVIALVLAGDTNAEIARKLDMHVQALKNALSTIYDKVGVSTRLQLAVLLLRDRTQLMAARPTSLSGGARL